ncbi:hypothetical protein [Actinomyces wuliandei]|uniref:hypothetical protein n=1 Tax=Actinomyces wuliandei TaxID=2057743 RepID=UPI000FD71E86|nr:hypothetical protein [Actinomyces wuliandei]
MSSDLQAQASCKTQPIPSRLMVVRLLFLAGALLCCAHAASIYLSMQRLPNGSETTAGPVVAMLALMLEHAAWWYWLRNISETKIKWAKRMSYMHVVMFVSATLNNSPQRSSNLLLGAPTISDGIVAEAAPPLLVAVSVVAAILLKIYFNQRRH